MSADMTSNFSPPADAARACGVSVITPVYRAEEYLRQAVDSALSQPETAEVILIEDGSPDRSLVECERLVEDYVESVRLLRHAGGANRGAGASRNLGIWEARCPYIAFLDADDLMLPGRYTEALRILGDSSDVDGVYEAVGTWFESPTSEEEWKGISASPQITTLRGSVPPEQLLAVLLDGEIGSLHLDGLVIRRSVFERVGGFSSALRLSQDSEMWWRMAAVCRLVGGRLDEPVAMRRRHVGNRFAPENPDYMHSQFEALLSAYRWARRRRLPEVRLALFREALVCSIPSFRRGITATIAGRRVAQLKRWLRAGLSCPALLVAPALWRRALRHTATLTRKQK